MTGKALVTAGLGGAIDFVPIPGGGSQASLKGAKLMYVVGQSLVSQWAIVTPKQFTAVEQLKGKTCGFGRPGSADYDEGEIVLSKTFHMNVGKDYKVISFQGEPERIAALINGDIQCALVSFPHAARGVMAGFKILMKTGDYLPRIGGVFWVTPIRHQGSEGSGVRLRPAAQRLRSGPSRCPVPRDLRGPQAGLRSEGPVAQGQEAARRRGLGAARHAERHPARDGLLPAAPAPCAGQDELIEPHGAAANARGPCPGRFAFRMAHRRQPTRCMPTVGNTEPVQTAAGFNAGSVAVFIDSPRIALLG
jgi:hypothetical protein